MDDCLRHDSSSVTEVIAQTLERVALLLVKKPLWALFNLDPVLASLNLAIKDLRKATSTHATELHT